LVTLRGSQVVIKVVKEFKMRATINFVPIVYHFSRRKSKLASEAYGKGKKVLECYSYSMPAQTVEMEW